MLGRAPGRDSYPGDIFYLHSKMIERACHLDEERGGGSMTFLPIVEILEGDLTAFVPSNLVSMTDGQIMLDQQMFGEGQRPALDLGLSVSRVGTKVQWPIIKQLSGPLRLEYLQFRELKRLAKLRSGAVQSDDMKDRLKSGEILTLLLKQDKDHPVKLEALAVILYAFHKKYLHKLSLTAVDKFQNEIYDFIAENNPQLLKDLRERKKMDDAIESAMNDVISSYIQKIAGVTEQEEEKETDLLSNIGKEVLEEATTKKK